MNLLIDLFSTHVSQKTREVQFKIIKAKMSVTDGNSNEPRAQSPGLVHCHAISTFLDANLKLYTNMGLSIPGLTIPPSGTNQVVSLHCELLLTKL